MNESSRAEQTFPASPAEVWQALTTAFIEMEIPVTEVQEPQRRLITDRVRVARIDGDRMGAFLDCGTNVSGQRADTYSITLDLVTTVEPAGPGSARVRTVLDASGHPRDTAGSPVHCTSTGELENRVFRRVFAGVVEGEGPIAPR